MWYELYATATHLILIFSFNFLQRVTAWQMQLYRASVLQQSVKDEKQCLITILLTVPANVELLASVGTLILQNVTSQDAGSYRCVATNYITGQTVTSHFSITLQVVSQGARKAPHFLGTPCTNYTIQAGNSFLCCVCCNINYNC